MSIINFTPVSALIGGALIGLAGPAVVDAGAHRGGKQRFG